MSTIIRCDGCRETIEVDEPRLTIQPTLWTGERDSLADREYDFCASCASQDTVLRRIHADLSQTTEAPCASRS